MKYIMLLLIMLNMLVFGYAVPYREDWELFKVKFNKKYESAEEENLRMKAFSENMAVIEKHNVDFKNGFSSFEMGMNQYGDLTQDEFEKIMLGKEPEKPQFFSSRIFSHFLSMMNPRLKKSKSALVTVAKLVESVYKKTAKELTSWMDTTPRERSRLEEKPANVTVDWVALGAVTPAKDQGYCGSCWAYSAVGALESHLYIETGKLIPLSVQNLIDCTNGRFGNSGCGGGHMTGSFEYIMRNGIASEKDYPYEAEDGKCRYEEWMSVGKCRGYVLLMEEMRLILSRAGPLSCVMDASSIQFRFYKSGIIENYACDPQNTNHAIVTVGYGPGYWKIKNSWGTTWGENGTARISARRPCGIDKYALLPIV